MRILLSLLLFAICMLSSVKAYAEDNLRYYCDQISISQGLNTVHVLCANRDNSGFLWIGTEHGLHRYDGENMRLYSTLSDSKSFCKVFFTVEDSHHQLWMGSDAGLIRYNPVKDTFEQYSSHYYSHFCKNENGVYFISNDHFLHYDPVKNQIAKIRYQSDAPFTFYSSLRIVPQDQNHFYVSSGKDRIYSLDRRNGKLKEFFNTQGSRITDLAVDSGGNLYVSTFEKGLFTVSTHGELKRRYHTANTLLASDVIVDLHLRNDTSLWMAVDGGGVYVMNTKTSDINSVKIMSSSADNESLRTIIAIDEDDDHNISLATRRTGLLLLKQNYIYSFLPSSLNSSEGPSLGALLGFLEDQEYIWIATDGNGINRFEKATNQFKHYPETFGMRVSSLDLQNETSVLFVAYRKGLYSFNKQSGSISKIEIPGFLEKKIRTGWVCPYVKRVNTSDDYLLLLDSAYLYNLKSRDVRNLSVGNSFKVDMALRLVHADTSSYTLFANQGVYEFDLKTTNIRKVFDFGKYRKGHMLSVTKTEGGVYWLIANDYNVYSYNPETDKFRPALLPLSIKPLIVVANGDSALWFGSATNIYRYNPKDDQIAIYGKSDGVHENEYIDRTFLITRENDLLLGGVNGFSLINPAIKQQHQDQPDVKISEIRVDGKSLAVDHDKQREIILPSGLMSVELSLMFKGKSLFDEYYYQYKLDGLMTDFELTNQKQLSFNQLLPGTYPLLIRFSKDGKRWDHPIELLILEVQSPWWKAGMISGALVVFMACILLLVYNSYKKKRKVLIQLNKTDLIKSEEVDMLSEDEFFRKQLISLIEQNISDTELDVDKLASLLAMSRSALYQRMRQTIGIGVKEYINSVRILKAKELLETTNLPIIEISERVGFSQQRYFSTVFKNINGFTPTEYRNMQRNQNNIV